MDKSLVASLVLTGGVTAGTAPTIAQKNSEIKDFEAKNEELKKMNKEIEDGLKEFDAALVEMKAHLLQGIRKHFQTAGLTTPSNLEQIINNVFE